jgi:hypothetical protein
MDQPYEYIQTVADPTKFIQANLDSKPSGLRMMLKEMQKRKRATGTTLDKGLVKEISLSAFDRATRRKKGE